MAARKVSQPLGDVERRTLAHLGIPRNVPDLEHVMRVDEHSLTRDGLEVHEHLVELEKTGLVHKLGEHRDPAKVAALTQKRNAAIALHDESAETFSRRLLAPKQRWRMEGDLWILSTAGLDALKQPDENEPAPMTVSKVQEWIDKTWACSIKHDAAVYGLEYGGADKPDGPRLNGSNETFVDGNPVPTLLEDEFLLWATAVADDCEGRWGERPIMPLAGGAQYTDAYEIALLDAENQKTALGAVVDPWFMPLVIVALTDVDTGTTAGDATHVPTYTGYARKSVAGSDMAAAAGAGGSVANVNAIIFAACTAGSSAIVGFGNASALTAGTLRKFGTCASTTISTTQTPPQFAVGALTTAVA